MMNLKAMFKLSSKVTVYVPSTTDVNIQTDNTKWVNECATILSNYFGGATSTDTLGYWVSNTEGLVKEKSTMVFAYCSDEDLKAHIDDVAEFCFTMKKELNQEAIAVEINGEMYFL